MRALSIAWKDIRHIYRDFAALAMMLVAPLLLAAALGAAFGSGDNFSPACREDGGGRHGPGRHGDTPRQAPTEPARHIVGVLTDPSLADVLDTTVVESADAARVAVDDGEADVAVIIPTGLTERLRAGTATGEPMAVEIYKDPATTVGPAIVAAIVGSVTQALDGARAAAFTAAELAAAKGATDPDELAALAAATAEAYGTAAQGAQPSASRPGHR